MSSGRSPRTLREFACPTALDRVPRLLPPTREAGERLLAGIRNVYVQAPLFKARIHPWRPIHTLSDDEVAALWRALRSTSSYVCPACQPLENGIS